jgi:adenine/guanine phosphoribosyltransferase-like PRPP-binding protein
MPELKYKLMTIELLNLAKNWYSYSELSAIIGLPERTLTRYVKGQVLPTIGRAVQLNKTLQRIMSLDGEIKLRLEFDKSNPLSFRYNRSALVSDTLLLERAVQHVMNVFAQTKITKVISTLSEALPLATLAAHRFGVALAIAAPYKAPGFDHFVEESYSISPSDPVRSLYIPSMMIRRGDYFLIVYDLMTSGEREMCTIAMTKMIKSAGAQVAGFFSLVSIGQAWKASVKEISGCEKIETVLQVDVG